MNNNRQEILEVLGQLSDRYPDMRLGQLVVNIANWATGQPDATWDLEDEAFLRAATDHLKQMGEREPSSGVALSRNGSKS